MNQVLTSDRLAGFCSISAQPPVDELRAIGIFLASKIGREAIAKILRVEVRVAVDTAGEVFRALPPLMKRVVRVAECATMRALWNFFFKDNADWRRNVRKQWSHLVDTGPIGDPLQIFQELAVFNAAVRPLLETITKIDGFTVMTIEGRDTLDAVTLARVFIGYVNDNLEGRRA